MFAGWAAETFFKYLMIAFKKSNCFCKMRKKLNNNYSFWMICGFQLLFFTDIWCHRFHNLNEKLQASKETIVDRFVHALEAKLHVFRIDIFIKNSLKKRSVFYTYQKSQRFRYMREFRPEEILTEVFISVIDSSIKEFSMIHYFGSLIVFKTRLETVWQMTFIQHGFWKRQQKSH